MILTYICFRFIFVTNLLTVRSQASAAWSWIAKARSQLETFQEENMQTRSKSFFTSEKLINEWMTKCLWKLAKGHFRWMQMTTMLWQRMLRTCSGKNHLLWKGAGRSMLQLKLFKTWESDWSLKFKAEACKNQHRVLKILVNAETVWWCHCGGCSQRTFGQLLVPTSIEN